MRSGISRQDLRKLIEEDVRKIKGVYYPVKAGFFRVLLTGRIPCKKLYPNPNDEFSMPEIGPNYEIIAGYEKMYRNHFEVPKTMEVMANASALALSEKLMVQKLHPDGYMILNGHHRWAAALCSGVKELPARIVNLTEENDVKRMMHAAEFNKRAALDLDEVVFCSPEDPAHEKGLPFPLNRIYKEKLRIGIPALFFELYQQGYDIWVYTNQYYSMDYLHYYFKRHHIHVTGIVTGLGRKAPKGIQTFQEFEKILDTKYESALHIDNRMVLRTFSGSDRFEDYSLSGASTNWSSEVIDILGEIKRNE